MTCKDCIHSEICLKQYSGLNEDMMFNECKKFKNKADFVEVVRCGRCERFIPDSELDHEAYPNPLEYDGFCDDLQVYMDNNDFCSYGERRAEE